MKLPKEKWRDPQSLLLGMSKKVLQRDGKENQDKCIESGAISKTMCISGVSSLIYPFMYINKMELIQHIRQDDKEKKG